MQQKATSMMKYPALNLQCFKDRSQNLPASGDQAAGSQEMSQIICTAVRRVGSGSRKLPLVQIAKCASCIVFQTNILNIASRPTEWLTRCAQMCNTAYNQSSWRLAAMVTKAITHEAGAEGAFAGVFDIFHFHDDKVPSTRYLIIFFLSFEAP